MKRRKGRGIILLWMSALLGLTPEHLSMSIEAKKWQTQEAEENDDFVNEEEESSPSQNDDDKDDESLKSDSKIEANEEQSTGSEDEFKEIEKEEVIPDEDIPNEAIPDDVLPPNENHQNEVNTVCLVIDAESFQSCVSDRNEINLKLEADLELEASQLPMIDVEVLSIDLNGHVLSFNVKEGETFDPLRCSLLQLINDTERAGGFFISSDSSNLPPLIEISSYGFLAGANAGIQFYSKMENYTIIDLSEEATMNIQATSLMCRKGSATTLIKRDGNVLSENDWIYFAGFNMYTEFLENQILYRYQMESPFLYAQDEDKYRVQMEWGDLDFVYDVGFVDEEGGTGVGWIGNDNVKNHVKISNYSQFPIYVSQSLTINDEAIDGQVYKEQGIAESSGNYDYNASELAKSQEMLLGSASNLPVVLDLYIVLSGKPDLNRYHSGQQIGSLTLSVISMETDDLLLSEDEYDLYIAVGEEQTIRGTQSLAGAVYRISGGGTAIFDEFEVVDAQDGALIAQADETSELIAGPWMDLEHYRFVDREARTVSYGESAVAIYYRKEEEDEEQAASDNEAIEEKPQ
ncbi:hypothetical protein DES51_10956 [Dielma fastidiosa]|uniref:Uncharacterized protein n=2 Tax=Dielma fastidiosa TaxID=1034346 RepID=A0A318KI72_9FIRM|nr:hypothetical protein DES51_10956 [Dielma fastidiosa]